MTLEKKDQKQPPAQSPLRGWSRISRVLQTGSHQIIASLLMLGVFLNFSASTFAQNQVARTKHNLAISGPGQVRTQVTAGVCVFCHTPHSASLTRALWNRELPPVTYQLYSSSTLKATLNQPTGSSRLCLSCHDGILALASLRKPPPGAPPSLGPLTGKNLLGTNISGDHPISFVYDSSLAIRRGELADPTTLPKATRLDADGQLQCTSCHEPHDDRRGKFLRIDNQSGALCTTCHKLRNWNGSVHFSSNATWNGVGTNPWPQDSFATVAQNACLNCHRSHNAAHPERLLSQASEPATCTVCHGGAVGSKNIEAEFLKPLHHPIEVGQWSHAPKEDPFTMPRHVACTDCHNPHAANSTPGTPLVLSGRLRGVSGVTIGGISIAEANFEHEVCSKCHGMSEPITPGIVRQSGTRNIRLKIQPSNASYHPVAASGVNGTILGLMPGYTASSVITCSSCHTNDDAALSGQSPVGPHGSRYDPILGWQYETNDSTIESYQNYALCYQCHNRDVLLSGLAGTFPHNKHVVGDREPCAACHDAHGSRQNAHLVDFMLRDRSGKAVVAPSKTQHRLEYNSFGTGTGQCYLMCHGVNHEPKSYP